MSTRRLEKLVEEKISKLYEKKWKFFCLVDHLSPFSVMVLIYVKDEKYSPYHLERSFTLKVSEDSKEAANEIFLELLFGG